MIQRDRRTIVNDTHGIINVYKEKGYTSHDVVAKLRGILGQRRLDAPETWIQMQKVFCRSAWERDQAL